MADDTPGTTTPDDDPLRWEAENRLRAGRFALIAGAFTLVGSIVTLLANAGAPRDEARALTLPDTLNRAAVRLGRHFSTGVGGPLIDWP